MVNEGNQFCKLNNNFVDRYLISAIKKQFIFNTNTMPYDVDGWIEIVWDLEKETKDWCGVINLNRFCLCGDDIADKLFGLTKHPCDNPYFAKRGVPKDCCEYVADEVRSCEEWVKKYGQSGEGDRDHTWALWSEIEPLLDDLERYNIDECAQWKTVFAMVQELCKAREGWMSRDRFKSEWIRFIVWGSW